MSDAMLWLVLCALLLASGLISASETALFSLTPSERRRVGPSIRVAIAGDGSDTSAEVPACAVDLGRGGVLLETVAVIPYSGKPLVGDLEGFYSVRLSYKDRIVYSVDENARIVFVHRAKTHYGD